MSMREPRTAVRAAVLWDIHSRPTLCRSGALPGVTKATHAREQVAVRAGLTRIRASAKSAGRRLVWRFRGAGVPPGDAEVGGDALERRALGGLVQINGLPTELVGVVLAARLHIRPSPALQPGRRP